MIVLHAIWDCNTSPELHIWAESSQLPMTVPRHAGRQSEKQKPRGHPFTLTQDALKETLGALAGNLLVRIASPDNMTLCMPSSSKGPLPSPELILEGDIDLSVAAFKPWDISTLALDPAIALDFLLALPGNPPRGLAFGSSLRFWRTAASLAFELIARQCYMPTVQELRQKRATTYRAAWEAALAPEDSYRVQTLSGMMPPISWAFMPPEEKKATLPQDMTLHFLNHTIDAFVRSRLSSTQLLPAQRDSRASATTLPAQWLQALASDDPSLTAPARELKEFSASMHTWLGQIRPLESNSPFRTCFRLDTPPADGNGGDGSSGGSDWLVSFLLQANDDRCLLVPAERVW
ncbi:MAG TPA: hypothetical protein VNE38_07485, partial [Ktedonobacteraceae bacterium]|nr:hypothetical protein [Ktedonobacteraceae bacterium]